MAAVYSSSPAPPLLPFSINPEKQNPNFNPSSPTQNLKPSILLILLILSITFLLSISLCLILRHLNRRLLRSVSTTSTISTTAAAASNRVSPEVSHDPVVSLIDSLPVFAYSSIKRRSDAASGECAVCLSKFEPEDQLRLLPLCCHAFHVPCIDTWLQSNQSCPLCRSPIHASDADILKALTNAIDGRSDSFRLEIGSISRRRQTASENFGVEPQTSYSFGGSFEYIVDDESEVNISHTHRRSLSDKEIGAGAQISQLSPELSLASEVGVGRSWLKEYIDRLSTSLSTRSLSFRSPGSFFTGSSRRSDIGPIGEYDVEANRVGEEISEMFRWVSGV